jgi:hypothetical protein
MRILKNYWFSNSGFSHLSILELPNPMDYLDEPELELTGRSVSCAARRPSGSACPWGAAGFRRPAPNRCLLAKSGGEPSCCPYLQKPEVITFLIC